MEAEQAALGTVLVKLSNHSLVSSCRTHLRWIDDVVVLMAEGLECDPTLQVRALVGQVVVVEVEVHCSAVVVAPDDADFALMNEWFVVIVAADVDVVVRVVVVGVDYQSLRRAFVDLFSSKD